MIKGFVKSGDVAAILTAAHKSGQNVVLYGRGGYGKSEMTLAFLRSIGARDEQITVKACSVGTTLDDLLGGINIKTLQSEGRIEYNLESSIFATPYLVLEEAFDAPVRVLEGLKDILTSKKVRNGAQSWAIKTKYIIVCTNRSKAELSEDASSQALMERFPLSLRVEWATDQHTLADYKELHEVVIGEPSGESFDVLISYMLESIKEDPSKMPPAPRTVVRMAKVMQSAGIQALRFMDGLPNIERALADLEQNAHRHAKAREVENALTVLKAERVHADPSRVTLAWVGDYNARVECVSLSGLTDADNERFTKAKASLKITL